MNRPAGTPGAVSRDGSYTGVRALAFACVLASLLLANCGAARQSSPPRATHDTRTGSPVASISPTSAVTATATATDIPLIVLTGATLGGTIAGFTAIYGAPSAPDRWDVRGTTFTVSLATGTDGLPHVVSLVVQPANGNPWTLAQAQQACGTFLPPDAAHQRDTTTASGDQEAIYFSAQLGSTFLPSAFGDTPPGTLALDYGPVSSGGIVRCGVAAGIV